VQAGVERGQPMQRFDTRPISRMWMLNHIVNQPSFFLYNVIWDIHTIDMAAWFTRWIQCQQLETTRTVICWDAQMETPRQ
jgi:hypothetical protein